MLPDLQLLGNGAVDAAGRLRKSFLFADGHVVALIDAARRENFRQQPDQRFLPALHAERGDLERKAVGKFIDRQAGQAVRFSEHDAAGIRKAEAPAVFPCAQEAAAEKFPVDRLVCVAREHADADLGVRVPETARGKAQAAVEHVHKAALFAGVVGPVQLVFKDPRRAPRTRDSSPRRRHTWPDTFICILPCRPLSEGSPRGSSPRLPPASDQASRASGSVRPQCARWRPHG